MRKQSKSMLVLGIFMAFVAMAVFLPGMNLAIEPPTNLPIKPVDATPSKEEKVKKPRARVAKTGETLGFCPGSQTGVPWPTPRFTDNEDGTVTDNLTDLIWLKNANFFGSPMQWWEACEACNTLADDGTELTDGSYPGDWGLANVKELHSLLDFGQPVWGEEGPSLPAGHPFSNVQADYYWSSTIYSRVDSGAWLVAPYSGYVDVNIQGLDYYVWCVRGGQ